jgi:hypothetical protein
VVDVVGGVVRAAVEQARVRRSERYARLGDREAESTHHLLRRYRRRVFLILPGPIWGMRHGHVDGRGRGSVRARREGDEGDEGWVVVQ